MKKLLTLALICIASWAWADDVKTVSGEFTYMGEASQGPAECKRLALEAARQDALAKEFGTIVSQTMYQQETVTNNRESSYADFMSSTEVKGEWISDIGEPEYKVRMDEDGNIVVYCKVRGKAKAISNEAVDFDALVLRNGTTRQHADTRFREGDQMFFYFRAPADGYLTLYLVDDQQTAWSLLPYQQDQKTVVEVKKNKEYVFFDPDRELVNPALVDVLTFTVDGDIERNDVYVLFSTNPFNKAVDNYVDENLPRQLPLKDFQKWLTRNRQNDKKMNLKRISIQISK